MAHYFTILCIVFAVFLGSLNGRYLEERHLSMNKKHDHDQRFHNIFSRAVSCPSGMCLSKFDYCGTSDAYCGEGCKGGPCHSGSSNGGNPPSPSGGNGRSGDGTFYDPGLGACGINSGGNELVCAVAAPDFDPETPNGNPNNNRLCGKYISVTGPKGTVTVKIVDRCPVCKSGDLDLSPAAFNQIGDPNQGRIHITSHLV